MDTNSEAWRLECEVRHIAAMTKDQRIDWFKAIKKHRGEAAANVLIEQVNAYRRAAFAATNSTSGISESTAVRIARAKELTHD